MTGTARAAIDGDTEWMMLVDDDWDPTLILTQGSNTIVIRGIRGVDKLLIYTAGARFGEPELPVPIEPS